MKDAVIILCGGGPAPGMNSVSMSVAKTFLTKGFRVIGLHGGYSGLFSKNARTEDLTFAVADRYFNRGGSYLQMSRFKPTDKDFEENFNLDLFKDNNIKLLVTIGGDDTASTANRISKFLATKGYPIANIHCPKTIDNDFRFLQTLLHSAIIQQRTKVLISQEQLMRTHVLQAIGSSSVQWAVHAEALHSVSVRLHTAR